MTVRTTSSATKAVYETISVIDGSCLFWPGDDALKAPDDGKQHLAKKEAQPLLIVGQNGTGKSTLTEILLQQGQIQELYQVLKVDLTLARNVCTGGIRGKLDPR